MVDLETAVRLATNSVVAVVLERDLLVVDGPGAAAYLQGQVSQDVEGLAVGATSWTLLLQPQGKIDAWLRVHRPRPDTFWLDTESGHGAGAQERLNRFKLRVEATITSLTVPALALRGPEAIATAGQQGADRPDGVIALDASWGGVDGVDLVRADGQLDPIALAGALGVGVAEGGVAEVIRIIQGRPAMGSELDHSTIPAAAGIVEPSVDFTKGCYVGQELVARIDSRGNNTPTRLHALRFVGAEVPAAGAQLTLDGAPVGTVTSVAAIPGDRTIGLGYLKRSVEAPATVTVATEGGATPVEVTALPPGPGNERLRPDPGQDQGSTARSS